MNTKKSATRKHALIVSISACLVALLTLTGCPGTSPMSDVNANNNMNNANDDSGEMNDNGNNDNDNDNDAADNANDNMSGDGDGEDNDNDNAGGGADDGDDDQDMDQPDDNDDPIMDDDPDDDIGGGTTPPVVNDMQDNEPVNMPPIADAGQDQNVGGNTLVVLVGSASSDPDGDQISFTWTQIAGEPVILADDMTPIATFTAPNVPSILTFQLTVSDDRGEQGIDFINVAVSQVLPQQLFVASFAGEVVSFREPAGLNGDVAPDTAIEVTMQTDLSFAMAVAVNSAGELIIGQEAGEPILVFDDARNVTGDIAPLRKVEGAATGLTSARPMFLKPYEPTGDILFVGDIASDMIHVFENVSTAAFDGDIAPVRTFTSTANNFQNPWSLSMRRDTLYVANRVDNNVIAFENASKIQGDVASRVISANDFTNVRGVFVTPSDALDILLVVDATNNQLYVFDDASMISGNGLIPDRIITVTGAVSLWSVVVDVNGDGYVIDSGGIIHIIDNILAADGNVTPIGTITGANTRLTMPIRAFILPETIISP